MGQKDISGEIKVDDEDETQLQSADIFNRLNVLQIPIRPLTEGKLE